MLFLDNPCADLAPLIVFIKKGVLPIVYIAIALILIILIMIDIGKCIISSDEKEVKAAQSRLIKRVIYAVVVFLVPQLVSLIMGIVSIGITDGSTGTWATCWNSVYIVNK